MPTLLFGAPALVRGSLSATRHVVGSAGRLGRDVATAPLAVVRGATGAGDGRQVWATGGWAVLEVRDGDAAVEAGLTAVDGVSWARFDPATRRVAVRFAADRLTPADLAAALAAVERPATAPAPAAPPATPPQPAARPEPTRPAPPAGGGPAPSPGHPASTADAVALAADVVALAVAAATRVARVPTLPSSTAALVAVVEHQPLLRQGLVRLLGEDRADLALALANAAVLGATGSLPSLAVDTAQRTQTVRVQRATEAVRRARAEELTGPHRPAAAASPPDDGRPVPLPDGPVERLVARSATGSLGVATALAAGTADLDLAGRALLAGIPRAATAARSVFADTLGLHLSRRGVLLLDAEVLRRLDRLTTVVVETRVLHGTRPTVLRAQVHNGWSRERVWRVAQRLLDARPEPAGRSGEVLVPLGDGDAGVRRFRLLSEGTTVGEVDVGPELDPLADAVLSAVRDAGLRLALTEDAAATALGGRADDVLRPGADGTALREGVRRLQADGQVVAVVGRDEAALDAADVGIGVVPGSGRVPWAADLLCGPGLGDLPRLLAAVPLAAETNRRGVRLALSSTSLSALLLAVGARRRWGGSVLPVHVAAAAALVSGVRAARRVDRLPDPVPVPHTAWHALDPAEVLGRLPDPGPPPADDPGPHRASPARRALRGVGALAGTVRAELADPLTPVLATGAAASAVIGSPTDSLLVGGVLTGSALISGAQRLRADRALRELLLDQRLPGRLVDPAGADRLHGRDGPVREVPAARLRPGHVIDLRGGDVVPADARLLAAEDLELDEATLTGESTAVGKQLAATPGAELPDRACMVYEGTTVLAGTGRAVVVAVGPATEAGRALALAGRAGSPPGMQARLEELTSKGLPVTLLGGAAVTALALLRGGGLRAAIGSGVAVAVAAVPEGLPLMATVAQLGAARRLSRRGVLVRASRTVEALGRVDTICFDKTGTLTEGRLRLVRVADLAGEWSPDAAPVRRVLRAAALATPQGNGPHTVVHATDQAVVDAARQVLGDQLDQAWEELAEIPFHSERRYSAAVGRTPGKVRLVVKGAPEAILPRCSHVRDDGGKRPLDRAGRDRAAGAVHDLAAQGLRVLAVARRNVGSRGERLPDDVAEAGDLTLLGFVGLADAARPRAAETVRALRDAGIDTVLITGDHPVTARAVAGQLGIPVDRLVTGPELAELTAGARSGQVAGASVFARVSPEQKLQIVQALRDAGRVVAMTGDGANDAAAIRLADVGIGMEARGSTSARTAADLVLTEPDVGLLLDALVEGRAMWRRVRDGVAVLLGGNAGELLFTLAGTALAGRAPISTRQFLVVNMFTDLLPSMALALAPTPTDAAARSALLAAEPPSLGAPLLRDIGARGVWTAAAALLAWQLARVTGTRRRAGTVGLAALVGAELGQTLLLGGRNPVVLLTGIGSAAVLAAVIQVPGVSQFFGCTPLGPVGWGIAVGCAAGATVASALLPQLLPRPAEAPLSPGRPDE